MRLNRVTDGAEATVLALGRRSAVVRVDVSNDGKLGEANDVTVIFADGRRNGNLPRKPALHQTRSISTASNSSSGSVAGRSISMRWAATAPATQ